MKRLLSIFLAALMCLTCVLAAPAPVYTVETASETAAEEAEVVEEAAQLNQETEPVRSLFFEYENVTTETCTFQDVNDLSKENGVLSFTAKVMDPRVTIPMTFNADDYAEIQVRMKWEGVVREGSTPAAQLFYVGTDKDGNAVKMQEAYSVKVYPGLSSEGEYRIIKFPLTNSNLKGMTVTKLALDPICNNGTVSLDYLMVVPKNDRPNMEWHFNTDGFAEGWGFNGVNGTVAGGVFSGTTNATNNVYSRTVTIFKGSDYPKAYVRLMYDNVTSNGGTLFYTNLTDENGSQKKVWWQEYSDADGNKYNYAQTTVSTSNNGAYKVHEYNFGQYVPYSDNYITSLYYNVNRNAADLNLDYIIFPHKNHFEWDFETTDYWGGLVPNKSDKQILADGKITFTVNEGDTYTNTNLSLSGLNLDANDWADLEVVLKHNITDEGNNPSGRVYFAGTSASGETISYSETNGVKVSFTEKDTGEGSNYYYYDFTSNGNWADSTITSIRFDVIKALASYEVDYMRLVPMPEGVNDPLDETDMKLTYEFEDEKAGTADGTVTVDFGSQIVNSAESVVLNWASGNATDGYTALADYTVIKKISGQQVANGYTMNKNMLIPAEATAIIATIKDCEKTFTLALDIPESKRKTDRGEPLYTMGLISDIHAGGWGSEKAPNVRLAAAREQLSKYTDFVVVNGDLTQWYGAYSGEEFKAYNFDGTKYGDNGVTSTEFIGIGNSQWTVLTDYFKGFSVPVYAVQGNHDIKDGSGWSDMLESEKHWRPFLEEWISYSNDAENGSKYENKVTLNEGVNYYDTEINGCHFIFTAIPKTQDPTYAFGEEQLKWLDKTLYEKEESGKPIFVFGHVPLETELNGSYWDDQIRDRTDVMAILAKHPTAVYTSGHTHYTLDVDYLSSIDGAQTAPSFIHDGGTTTINVPKDESNPNETTEIEGSHGVVAKVYSDGVELWGRDFVNDMWISRGYTYLTFKDECAIDDISVVKTATDEGVKLCANTVEGATYTWVLDGVESTVTANEIVVPYDFTGYVALRITDSNGAYRSEVFEGVTELEVKTHEAVSMRVDDVNARTGIRFASEISLVDRANAVEYGFIVTRKTFLDRFNGELTFDFTTEDGTPLYVYGENYLKSADGTVQFDKIYKSIEDGVIFTGVVTGLDFDDAAQICEVLVARSYAKLTVNGVTTVVYGKTHSSSVQQAASAIRESNSQFYLDNKELVDKLADTQI